MTTPIIEKFIHKWASDRNLIAGTTLHHQALKLHEEAGELARAVLHDNRADTIDAIGDAYVVLCNMAAKLDTTLDECAWAAYAEIKDRKGKMINGTYVKESGNE